MNNEGKITIFLCIITSAALILFSVILNGLKVYSAKTKAVAASDSAVSGVKADYNSYIFEHYHILLLDKDYGGYGEGRIEEIIEGNLEYTLGEEYEVESVVLSDTVSILDNDCEEFKRQITDYLKYSATEYAVDELVSAAGGEDRPVDVGTLDEMDNVVYGVSDESEYEAFEADNASEESDVKDPRNRLMVYDMLGIHMLIAPENLLLSENTIIRYQMPSFEYTNIFASNDVNIKFNDYENLKRDISGGAWINSMVNDAAGIVYAQEVFKCVTDDKNMDSYLNLEMEYIICGKESDYENYKAVVNRILALRLPVNYAYLISDVEKMNEIKKISFSISVFTAVPEPVVRYLIAGCWAYIEGMVEVKGLLEGKTIPYVKNSDNWITHLDRLGNINEYECPEDENGMDYKGFLMVLMVFDMDGAYYRMLDIIELNTRQEYEDFRIKNAITGFTTDISVSYQDNLFEIRKEAAY